MVSELDKLKDKYDINAKSEMTHKDHKERVDLLKGVTLIVGSSGSGKSTMLRNCFDGEPPLFPKGKPIIECFDSISLAEKFLIAFGLRSVPTWFRDIDSVSNGEKHRAECAYSASKGFSYIDEFTSVVDRNTAKSLAVAVRKMFDSGELTSMCIASCHRDIIEWLQPDNIFDADYGTLQKGRLLRQRPEIEVEVRASSYEDWVLFGKHHYLDSKVVKSCHFYTAYIEDQPVAFSAIIHRCNRDIKSYWGESRVVVLPEFQGLGIGFAMSELLGNAYTSRGLRYFSKTAHPAFGLKRNSSDKWRATSTNMQRRRSYLTKEGKARKQSGFGKTDEAIYRDAKRVCFSHEYIG